MLRDHCGVESDLDAYRALELDKIVWVFMDYMTDDGVAHSEIGVIGCT